MKSINYHYSVFLTFFVIILFLSSCSKSRKSDQEREHLKGKISSYTDYRYHTIEKFGEIQKGSLFYKEVCKYNNNGDRIEYNTVYGMDKGAGTKKTYHHTNKGAEVTEDTYDENGVIILKQKSTYTYDKNENISELNTYEENGVLAAKWIYKYNDKGQKVESMSYDDAGKVWIKSVFKYDNKENLIEQSEQNEKYTLKSTYKYEEFDKKGNWTKMIVYENDKSVGIMEREIHYQ